MKKFLSILLLMLVLGYAGKAQTVIFSEDFESVTGQAIPTGWTSYDADGDGQNWYGINDSTQASYAHSGNGFVTSASYIQSGALTPNNWLVTPSINLTGGSVLNYYIAGQDPSYAEEHYSVWISTAADPSDLDAYTMLFEETIPSNESGAIQYFNRTVLLLGQTGNVHIAFRHHGVTDMFRINLDDVSVATLPTVPTIACEDTLINFSYRPVGGTPFALKNFIFTAYSLTGSVDIAVPAPFQISTDSISGFGQNVTIAPNQQGCIINQVVYVKAVPTAAGTYSEMMSLTTNGGEEHQIHLTARYVDCSQNMTLPWREQFNSGIFPPTCWTLQSQATGMSESGYEYTWGNHGSWAVCTGDENQDQNEKLLTPTFDLSDITGTLLFSFGYRTNPHIEGFGSDDISLHLDLSTNGGASWNTIWTVQEDLDAYTEVWNSDWPVRYQTLDFTQFVGQDNVKLRFTYICHEGFSCQVWIANIDMDNFSEPIISAGADTLNFFSYIGEPTSQDFNVNVFNFPTPVQINATSPFEVSVDGSSYTDSATMSNGYHNRLYVRYNPTVAGHDEGTVTLTGVHPDTTVTQTIVVTGNSFDCSGVVLPISESFESAAADVLDPNSTEYCWTNIYENEGEINNLMKNTNENAFVGNQSFRFASNFFNPDGVYGQYLISPELNSTEDLLVYFNYAAGSALKNETFAVGYSTTGKDIDDFTWEDPIVTPANTDWNYYLNEEVPANTKYIAIHYTSAYKQFLYIDNFKVQTAPSCMFPLGLTVLSTNDNSAEITWTAGGDETSWQMVYGIYPVDVQTATPDDVATLGTTLTNLTANTHYQFYLRANCGEGSTSIWADPVDFWTTFAPAEVPYTQGFEANDPDVNNWVLQNGNQPNKFVVGTGAHAQGSSRGLYISNDNSTNEYAFQVGENWNSSYSTVWAYRDIYFTPTTEAGYLFTFKWRGYGETDFDVAEVFIGNATAVTNFDRNENHENFVDINDMNYTPAGLTKLCRLSDRNQWTNASYLLPASTYSGTTKRIYFLWTNDSLSGQNPPIAFDDVNISVPQFATISGTVTDASTQAPIANAAISMIADNGLTYTTTTDENGNYSVAGIVIGSYDITVVANGYEAYTDNYGIGAGAQTFNFQLSQAPCTIVPTGLTITNEEDNTILEWNAIQGGIYQQCHGSSVETYIGASQSQSYTLGAYHLYKPEHMTHFNGGTISHVGFVPNGSLTYTTYIVRIYVGGSGDLDEGPASQTPVYELTLTPDQLTLGEWNDIEIEPYKINGSQCLWVGYEAVVAGSTGIYALGALDGSNPNLGFGDVTHNGSSWMTMTDLGLDYNWANRITVEVPHLTYTIYADGQEIISGIEESYYSTAYDPSVECYQVSTTCENGVVSTLSACASGVGISDNSNSFTSSFSIYPNPATEEVTVSTTMIAQKVEVLNYLGQVLYTQSVNGNVFTLNVANYADGVYFIRLSGNEGVATQKLIKK